MNMLDKLFSRELNRRTGAHAISIYIDSIEEANKQRECSVDVSLKKEEVRQSSGSVFYRLNVRFPWLKLMLICLIGVIAIVDLLDLTISKTGDPWNKIRVAPMSRHIRATERVFKDKKLIALTFDDGPSSVTTPGLLDILFEKDVLATFFTLGNMARGNSDIVKRAEKEGHEIASHTMYHQNLIRIPASAAVADIDEAKDIIKDITGHNPKYTRPPYGNTNNVVRDAVGTPIILWSVDSEDWRSKNVDAIIATCMSEIHDGAIILMHDIYSTTVDSVPILIDKLREDGYEFVTISELTRLRGVELESGVSYYNIRP